MKFLLSLIPRHFHSHYWDSIDKLHYTKWWQWFGYCFFIYDRIIEKLDFSTFSELIDRVLAKDKEACLIGYCLSKIGTLPEYKEQTALEVYNRVIAETKKAHELKE